MVSKNEQNKNAKQEKEDKLLQNLGMDCTSGDFADNICAGDDNGCTFHRTLHAG